MRFRQDSAGQKRTDARESGSRAEGVWFSIVSRLDCYAFLATKSKSRSATRTCRKNDEQAKFFWIFPGLHDDPHRARGDARVPEDARGLPEDRRFTVGLNDPGPALICLSRDRRWRAGHVCCARGHARGQAFRCPRTARARGCPRTGPTSARGHAGGQAFHGRLVPEDSARGQAFHGRLERSRPRADLSFTRSPLAGRPRLLGAAAHSGMYRDRTAGGARDECMRSRQRAELARRRSHRMQYPTIGGQRRCRACRRSRVTDR